MARYIKDSNGNLICTAGGTRTWICTEAEHDRRVAAGTAPNNCIVNVIDDYSESSKDITDKVTVATVYAGYVSHLGVFKEGHIVHVHFRFEPTGNYNSGYAVLLTGLPNCMANDGVQVKPYTMTDTTTFSPTIYAYSRASSGDLFINWAEADKNKIWVFDFSYYAEE